MRNLMPIGRFSEICRLSIPTLRYYDELGLLPPAAVDADTGYRYYTLDQAAVAEKIRSLRLLEMPLPEIREILGADRETEKRILEGPRNRLREQTNRQQYALVLLDSLIREEPAMEYEIHLRDSQPQTAASIRSRVPWAELGNLIPGALGEIASGALGQGRRLAGPPFAITHTTDDPAVAAEIDIEVGFPVDRPVEPVGRVTPIEIPGGPLATTMHVGPYEAIGPAYQALGKWVQEHGHEATGPCREIYLVGPEEGHDPGTFRTEVVWPIK
jgi:DNA-binding transcriptional MerR regulator/DNA gyrase inhibitor GyrI